MKTRDLVKIGIPAGAPVKVAVSLATQAFQDGLTRQEVMQEFAMIAAAPQEYTQHARYAALANELLERRRTVSRIDERTEPARYTQYGEDLDDEAVRQMNNACRLPISIYGALMPDAHVGYGLPIGGVLATDNAVIPYAVGVDIACRMKMSVIDLPLSYLRGETEHLIRVLERETSFGVGAHFKQSLEHPVMQEDWSVTPVTRRIRENAARQLGTSGSGNHFVEYGVLEVRQEGMGLTPGKYVSILSHSGSRNAGQQVAQYYSDLAKSRCRGLPHELHHLSWLSMDSQEGQQYWAAMELMGRYASANHELIHRRIVRALKVRVLSEVENHHNFAWREEYEGREVIVHRKGATPAGRGVIGIIPGSMATPGYVVRGRGEVRSLNSASHGAGRALSRKQAKQSFTWSAAKKMLKEHDVTLVSAGLDEVPMAYKDIETVMAAQRDLVDIIAKFSPKIVKMAPGGERPED